MGTDPDAIDRQIATKRREIEERVAALKSRVRQDMRAVAEEAKGRASEAAEKTKGSLGLAAQMQEHPASLLSGAFGVGLVCGMIGGLGERGSDRRKPSRAHEQTAHPRESQSWLGGLLGPALDDIGGTISDEIRQLIRDVFASLHADGRPQARQKESAAAAATYGGD